MCRFPRDPNAPKNVLTRKLFGISPQYHIKGDPLGQAASPKARCTCGWADCNDCEDKWQW